MLNMHGMSQQILKVTRETNTSATILEYITCNTKDRISQFGELLFGVSEHYITYFTREVAKECINKHKTIKI